MDQRGKSLSCHHRAWHARIGQVVCRGKQLHTPDDFQRIQLLYLRLQVRRPLHHRLQYVVEQHGQVQGQAPVLCHQFRRSAQVTPLQSHQSEIHDGYLRCV